jgi:hypothetical protein
VETSAIAVAVNKTSFFIFSSFVVVVVCVLRS